MFNSPPPASSPHPLLLASSPEFLLLFLAPVASKKPPVCFLISSSRLATSFQKTKTSTEKNKEQEKKKKNWWRSSFYFSLFRFCSIEGEAVRGDTWWERSRVVRKKKVFTPECLGFFYFFLCLFLSSSSFGKNWNGSGATNPANIKMVD